MLLSFLFIYERALSRIEVGYHSNHMVFSMLCVFLFGACLYECHELAGLANHLDFVACVPFVLSSVSWAFLRPITVTQHTRTRTQTRITNANSTPTATYPTNSNPAPSPTAPEASRVPAAPASATP